MKTEAAQEVGDSNEVEVENAQDACSWWGASAEKTDKWHDETYEGEKCLRCKERFIPRGNGSEYYCQDCRDYYLSQDGVHP